MAWFDKYKEVSCYVCDSDEHNKYWTAVMDVATNNVTITWGRIGTAGGSQKKEFGSKYDATRFIETKVREKTNKGYVKIKQADLDKRHIMATIVGSQNKCDQLQWVEIVDASMLAYKPVDEVRLAEPDCEPGLLVDVEVKKPIGGTNKFTVLFTYDKAYKMNGAITPITKSHPLYEFTEKIETAIGRTMT